MADDLDRALARLAVEQGLLGRDEAAQYWQQIQAPGSPRFVQVLLQSGRLRPPDVERLRALWQQQQGGQPPGQPQQPQRPNNASQPRVPAPSSQGYGRPSAPAPQAAPPAATTPVDALGDDGAGSWDEALQRDQQLARILLSRSLTTQDRLRECRQLQLQHRMRLAPVLVKKNYVERAAVEDALAAVRAAHAAGAGTGRMRVSGAAPALPTQPGPSTPAPQDNPFSMPAGVVDQDNMPTLNVGPGGFNRPPMPQDAIPTIMGAPGNASLDEMNPFGAGGPPSGGAPPRPAPRALPNPVLSGDELDAFTDIPLQPLNQSARIVRGSAGVPAAASPAQGGNGPGGTGWGPGPGVLPDTNAEASSAPAPEDAPPVVEDPSERPAAPKKKTTAPQPPKKGGKGLLIAIVLFVLLLLGGGGAAAAYYYFVVLKK